MSTMDSAVSTALEEPYVPPQRGRATRRFVRHRLALAGLLVFLLVTLTSIFAPVLAPYDPGGTDLDNLPASGPSSAHLLGTDDLGEDVLSRLIYGGRISLEIGVSSALISLVIGVVAGAV